MLGAQTRTINLWEGAAPDAKGDAPEDTPTLAIYPATAQSRTSSGVVVFPGGGYVHLAMDHEGRQIAEWLNGRGISAFVLKYRLGPKYQHPVEMHDAQRAIRYVRAHASELGVDRGKIGVWGFSAGGHLASTVGTHFDAGNSSASDPIDRESSRPDLLILAYPVIEMQGPYVHAGSMHALLGEHPDEKLASALSNDTQVTADTPPTFLFHTSDDDVVPVQNSLNFYEALRKSKIPAEMHVYEHGKHGVGLAPDDPILHTWSERLAAWLTVHKF